MIHTAYINNTTLSEKKTHCYKKGIQFENKLVSEDYMTSENFWKEADKRIINVCKQYGVI